MLIIETPVEFYKVQGFNVMVKREDLCCMDGPPFSKVRGVYEHMKALKAQGIHTVGYVETSISMAGIAVAAVAAQLGMISMIYDPQYKNECETLDKHRTQWLKYGAQTRTIAAGMAKVNYNICKKRFETEFPQSAIMLPLGLPFVETVRATEAEMVKTLSTIPPVKTVVVNVGSGTICAGVWRGLTTSAMYTSRTVTLYGVMGRTGDINHKLKNIEIKALLKNSGLRKASVPLKLIDPGWNYTQASTVDCPFPCNKYYDRKSWQWLTENIETLKEPILFWNIGSEIQ